MQIVDQVVPGEDPIPTEEDAYLFVVFDGGDTSVAEIRLKEGLANANFEILKSRSMIFAIFINL